MSTTDADEQKRLESLIAEATEYVRKHRNNPDMLVQIAVDGQCAEIRNLSEQLALLHIARMKGKANKLNKSKLSKMAPSIQVRQLWKEFCVSVWGREYRIEDDVPDIPADKRDIRFVISGELWDKCVEEKAMIYALVYDETGSPWDRHVVMSDWLTRKLKHLGVAFVKN